MTSSHELWVVLTASRAVDPVQKVFSFFFPDPLGESLPMAAVGLCFLNNKTSSQNFSLIHGLQKECVSRHKINLVYFFQCFWVTGCIANEQ